jgi:elongation factor P
MKIDAIDIRVGNILEYQGKLWAVAKTMHTKPGKGGAFMQVEMKCISDGTKTNVRFRSSETVEKVRLDQKDYQFLYRDGQQLELMDKESFEQISASIDIVPEEYQPFLQDGMDVVVESYDEKPILLSLPETIVLEVAECEPVVKGQTAASSYKPGVLANGVRIMVPPFINIGDKVVVRVSDQQYIERAK